MLLRWQLLVMKMKSKSMSLNLTKADQDRMILYKATKGNPVAIMLALEQIRLLAKQTLETTIKDAESKVFIATDEKTRKLINNTKEELEGLVDRVEKDIRDFDRQIDTIKHKAESIKPQKGDKGDSPTREALLSIIRPLIPTKDYILSLIKSVMPEQQKIETLSRDEITSMVLALVPKDKPVEGTGLGAHEITNIVESILSQKFAAKRKGWFGGGGGGDLVGAGTGVEITTNAIGRKIINVTASGGGTVSTPVGDVDSSNTSFTVTAEPKWVVADGITYYDGAGYTYAALTITMDIAPSQYVRYIT